MAGARAGARAQKRPRRTGPAQSALLLALAPRSHLCYPPLPSLPRQIRAMITTPLLLALLAALAGAATYENCFPVSYEWEFTVEWTVRDRFIDMRLRAKVKEQARRRKRNARKTPGERPDQREAALFEAWVQTFANWGVDVARLSTHKQAPQKEMHMRERQKILFFFLPSFFLSFFSLPFFPFLFCLLLLTGPPTNIIVNKNNGVQVANGYLGFGFSKDGSMWGGRSGPGFADGLAASYATSGLCAGGCLYDVWMPDEDDPRIDAAQSFTNKAFSVKDGYLTVEFTRLVRRKKIEKDGR